MNYETVASHTSYLLDAGTRAIAEIPSRTPTQITTLGEKTVSLIILLKRKYGRS